MTEDMDETAFVLDTVGLESIKPVRRGYEQIADQLRTYIQDGALPPGARLPSEEELAKRFGVSRATVREALRLLAAWNLVCSTVGRRGGTFVAKPDVEHVTELIRSNIALLTAAKPISLEALLEVRTILEVPAAGLAAERMDDESLEKIRSWLVPDIREVSAEKQGLADVHFHLAVIEAAKNPMLMVAAQPLLEVLTSNLRKIPQPLVLRQGISDCHHSILQALEARDPDRAQGEMSRHLKHLRPYYRRASELARGGKTMAAASGDGRGRSSRQQEER